MLLNRCRCNDIMFELTRAYMHFENNRPIEFLISKKPWSKVGYSVIRCFISDVKDESKLYRKITLHLDVIYVNNHVYTRLYLKAIVIDNLIFTKQTRKD